MNGKCKDGLLGLRDLDFNIPREGITLLKPCTRNSIFPPKKSNRQLRGSILLFLVNNLFPLFRLWRGCFSGFVFRLEIIRGMMDLIFFYFLMNFGNNWV